MNYEILDEEIKGKIQTQFDERSTEWTLEQVSNAFKNYTVELEDLVLQLRLQEKGLELYLKDPSILKPIFAYEADKEYAELLRDSKLPKMKADINEARGKMESTHFQLGLMENKIKAMSDTKAEEE